MELIPVTSSQIAAIGYDPTTGCLRVCFRDRTNKKTGAESVIVKQVKHHDHSFGTTSTSIILAMVAGFYPLGDEQQQKEKSA